MTFGCWTSRFGCLLSSQYMLLFIKGLAGGGALGSLYPLLTEPQRVKTYVCISGRVLGLDDQSSAFWKPATSIDVEPSLQGFRGQLWTPRGAVGTSALFFI